MTMKNSFGRGKHHRSNFGDALSMFMKEIQYIDDASGPRKI